MFEIFLSLFFLGFSCSPRGRGPRRGCERRGKKLTPSLPSLFLSPSISSDPTPGVLLGVLLALGEELDGVPQLAPRLLRADRVRALAVRQVEQRREGRPAGQGSAGSGRDARAAGDDEGGEEREAVRREGGEEVRRRQAREGEKVENVLSLFFSVFNLPFINLFCDQKGVPGSISVFQQEREGGQSECECEKKRKDVSKQEDFFFKFEQP